MTFVCLSQSVKRRDLSLSHDAARRLSPPRRPRPALRLRPSRSRPVPSSAGERRGVRASALRHRLGRRCAASGGGGCGPKGSAVNSRDWPLGSDDRRSSQADGESADAAALAASAASASASRRGDAPGGNDGHRRSRPRPQTGASATGVTARASSSSSHGGGRGARATDDAHCERTPASRARSERTAAALSSCSSPSPGGVRAARSDGGNDSRSARSRSRSAHSVGVSGWEREAWTAMNDGTPRLRW